MTERSDYVNSFPRSIHIELLDQIASNMKTQSVVNSVGSIAVTLT